MMVLTEEVIGTERHKLLNDLCQKLGGTSYSVRMMDDISFETMWRKEQEVFVFVGSKELRDRLIEDGFSERYEGELALSENQRDVVGKLFGYMQDTRKRFVITVCIDTVLDQERRHSMWNYFHIKNWDKIGVTALGHDVFFKDEVEEIMDLLMKVVR